jgi:BRCT domain type II-containing protein
LIIQIVFFIYKLGVLPSLEREECKKIIECYGGRVTTAVSGKTDYLLTRPGKIDTDAKPTVTKPAKATVAKPIDMNSFVTVSPKFRGDKQDDGNLCKC